MTSPAGERVDSQWFVPLVEDPRRPVAVLALPHAGGGCATFADCAARLSPRAALWGLNLPGRQARFGEPARTDLSGLVADLAGDVRKFADRPYVLFGYCSGALLAFLVTRELRAAGSPAPRALVVASYPPPQFARPPADLHHSDSDSFWTRTILSGRFPAALAAEPGFREVFEPALRADFEMLAGFRYADEPPLETPVVALTGRADETLRPTQLAPWADQTSAEFTLHVLDADHWLLDNAVDRVAGVLDQACRG
jgi:medium-chain acyl-[acyl-carrier-protein] hydrolase